MTAVAGSRNPRPLRVTFVLDNFEVGGTELNAVRVAERIDRDRFAVDLVSLHADGPLRSRFERVTGRIDTIDLGGLISGAALQAGWRLRGELRERGVDVVHAHDRYANVFAVPWARAAGVPGVIASKRWQAIERRHAILNRIAFRLADRVLANSALVGRSLTDVDGVDPRKVAIVPNFVDDTLFEPVSETMRADLRRSLGVELDALVIGAVANLRPVKDLATLVRATAQVAPAWPSLRLVLVGGGAERQPLAALAASLGIDGIVHFAGSRDDGARCHAAFDITVLCSVAEGFPNAVVEAMAAGRPVVATRVGGVPDAVDQDVTGLMVPPGDPAALATALRTLLSDPARRAAFGAVARTRAIARFSAPAAIGAVQSLYELVAGRTRAADTCAA